MEKAAPVLESGEAGPPGSMLSSHPPQGSNASKTPVKSYASAPGGKFYISLLLLLSSFVTVICLSGIIIS